MGFVRRISEVNIGYQYGDKLLLVFIVQQPALNDRGQGRRSGRHPERMDKLMKQGLVRKDSAGLVLMVIEVFGTGTSLGISFWPEVDHGFNQSSPFRGGLRGGGAVAVAFRVGTNLQNTIQDISRIMSDVIRNAFQQDPAHVGALYLDQSIQRSRFIIVSGPIEQIDPDSVFLFEIV
jgi:hypothetical protein